MGKTYVYYITPVDAHGKQDDSLRITQKVLYTVEACVDGKMKVEFPGSVLPARLVIDFEALPGYLTEGGAAAYENVLHPFNMMEAKAKSCSDGLTYVVENKEALKVIRPA